MMNVQTTPSMAPTSPPVAQSSPWHSPVPYLFGGLAAMLGLIAFALLILACSYWKLSGNFDDPSDGERDLEAGNAEGDSKPDNIINNNIKKAPPVLVLVPGETKATFLATPISSRASSFGNSSCRSNSTTTTTTTSGSEVEMTDEKDEQGSRSETEK